MSSLPSCPRRAAHIVAAGKSHQPTGLILVVETYEPLRQMLRRMLESRQHRVLLAAGGGEALELWHARAADLLMLDLHLPDVDGLESFVQFRAAAPELPIIVMSGGDQDGGFETLGEALLLGATAALAKPFHLRETLDLVARVLGPARVRDTVDKRRGEDRT